MLFICFRFFTVFLQQCFVFQKPWGVLQAINAALPPVVRTLCTLFTIVHWRVCLYTFVPNRKIQLVDFVKLYPDLEDEDVAEKISTDYLVCFIATGLLIYAWKAFILNILLWCVFPIMPCAPQRVLFTFGVCQSDFAHAWSFVALLLSHKLFFFLQSDSCVRI